MAEQYGFYVSLRLPSGELCSSFRETVAEVKADLDMFLGEGTGSRLASKMVTIETPKVVTQVVTDEQAAANIKDVFPTATPVAEKVEAQEFEACNVCGTLKDQWRPPGVSKAGKPYQGFFSCPNWKNHPK